MMRAYQHSNMLATCKATRRVTFCSPSSLRSWDAGFTMTVNIIAERDEMA